MASTSSTISPSHLADAVDRPERFLIAHWLNPAHIIPLVEVVPGPRTAPATVDATLHRLERQGWISAEWGASDNNRRAKYYELTRAGRRALGEETESWRRFAAAVEVVLRTT